MSPVESSSNRLALPDDTPVKRWQVVLAVALLLFILGGIIALVVWSGRRTSHEEADIIRPTYAAGQEMLFTLPRSVGKLYPGDVAVRNAGGEAIRGMEIALGDGERTPSLRVTNPETLKPGTYTIEVTRNDKRIFAQDFSWGVLALNFAKSTYAPGEEVALNLAILDEKGGMICDAEVTLNIVSPTGATQTLSSADGQIVTHPECQLKEYVTVPDYETHFRVQEVGNYQLALTATTRNGVYQIHDFVTVEQNPWFVVERKANTRIYPPENYPVALTVYSRHGFKGSVTETMRSDFALGDEHNALVSPGEYAAEATDSGQPRPKVRYEGDKLLLTWENLEIAAGESTTLDYEFNAPDVSPELYVIGPTELHDANGKEVFIYSRPHQLAMDDLPPTDPVARWKFDENTGTTALDHSGAARNLALSSASWVNPARSGAGWNGDGAKWLTRADDNNFDFGANDSFTIAIWFKSDSTSNPATQEWLLNKSLSGGTQQAGYAFYAKTDGTVCFGVDGDTTWTPDAELCTSGDVYDNSWHHILVSRDVSGQTLALFIDGIEESAIATGSDHSFSLLDSTGDVGRHTSIAMGTDGYLVISYYDVTNADLKVAKCANAACSSGTTLTTVDSAGNVGQATSIAIGTDGYPVISYYDSTNFDLKVAKCANAACSSGTTVTTVDSTGIVGQATSIAIGTDGYPVVSYYDNTNGDLKVAKCANAACSSGTTLTTVDSIGTVGVDTSIAIGTDGFPVIAYRDLSNLDLKVAKCANAACSSGTTLTTVDSTGNVGNYLFIAIGADDYPVITHYDQTNFTLKVAKCANAACSLGTSHTTIDPVGNLTDSSIAIGVDDFPVISYYDSTNLDLKVAKCANAACSSGTTLTTLDSVGSVGNYASLAIGTDGYPVISYYDETNGDLKVAKCGSATCSTSYPLASLANSRQVYLGDRQGADGGDEFSGDIDETVIYRAAFTAAQALTEYERIDHPTSQPVGYWKLDEGSGTLAADSSALGNNLTLSSVSWSPDGKKDGAWNGTGGVWMYRNAAGDFDFAAYDSFTISLWFKSDSASNPGSPEWLLNKSLSGGTQQAGYAIYAKTDGKLCFGWDDDTTWNPDTEICTTEDVYDNTWHHLVATRDAGTGQVSLYLDKELMASAAANTLATLDLAGDVGWFTSTVIGTDGYPVISYYDVTNFDLKVAKCANAACSSGTTFTTLDAMGIVGEYTSIAIGSDGFPVVSYYNNTNADLKVAKCANAACSSGTTTTTLDSTGNVGQYTSIAIGADSYPVISYQDTTNSDLKVAKCANAACSSGTTFTALDATGIVGLYTSIAIGSDGYPVISYYDAINADLKVAKCANAACSSGTTLTTLDATGIVGEYTFIAIGTQGFPIISYYDSTNLDLKVAKCGNAACNPTVPTSPLSNSRILYLGDRQGSNGTDEFNGDLDEVKLYRAPFGAAQIAAEYNSVHTPGAIFGNPLSSTSTVYCPPGNVEGRCGQGNPAPAGEWKLDENTGTSNTYDASGNNFAGTLTGIAQGNWAPGVYGSALSLNGSTTFVDFSLGPATVNTVSFWVYPKSTTGYFLNLTGTTDYIWANSGTLSATGFSSPVYYVNGVRTGTPTIVANHWQYVTITTENAENASNLEFGSTQNTNYLEGIIDHVLVYDYVRTPAQIA